MSHESMSKKELVLLIIILIAIASVVFNYKYLFSNLDVTGEIQVNESFQKQVDWHIKREEKNKKKRIEKEQKSIEKQREM